jgi:hypothetical protein
MLNTVNPRFAMIWPKNEESIKRNKDQFNLPTQTPGYRDRKQSFWNRLFGGDGSPIQGGSISANDHIHQKHAKLNKQDFYTLSQQNSKRFPEVNLHVDKMKIEQEKLRRLGIIKNTAEPILYKLAREKFNLTPQQAEQYAKMPFSNYRFYCNKIKALAPG